MNYTTNYHLPQWVESDRILMEDFNEAMENIDGGIKGAKDAASVAQTAAESAQSTANTAESKADAAQSTADNAFCSDYMPFAIGSYTGTGEPQTITLGFKPNALIIMRNYEGSSGEDALGTWAFATTSSGNRAVQLLADGFRLPSPSSSLYPAINWNNYYYNYIAFR